MDRPTRRRALVVFAALFVVAALAAFAERSSATGRRAVISPPESPRLVVVRVPTTASVVRTPVVTLVSTAAPIVAFAQDGSRIAWVTRPSALLQSLSASACARLVRMRDLAKGKTVSLTSLRGATCSTFKSLYGHVPFFQERMAVAGSRALWAINWESMHNHFEVFVGASGGAADRQDGSLELSDNFVNTNVPMAGDGSTLVWVDLKPWSWQSPSGYGVRVAGRPGRVTGTDGAYAVAAAGASFAYAVAEPVGTEITIRRAADGELQSVFGVPGRVTAIALTATHAAVLVRSGSTRRLVARPRPEATGSARTAIVAARDDQFSMAGRWIVFLDRDGRRIHAFDVLSGRDSIVARASGGRTILGLSIEGRRIAWAESGPRSFIRAAMLAAD